MRIIYKEKAGAEKPKTMPETVISTDKIKKPALSPAFSVILTNRNRFNVLNYLKV